MRITPEHTKILMSALSAAASFAGTAAEVEYGRTKLRALDLELAHRERSMVLEHAHYERIIESRQSHEQEMFDMKAGVVRDLIHALIEQRVDAVRQGFVETLTMYAEQCRHYMAQQDRYADAEIKAIEPLESANIRARLSEIDLRLTSIRSEAAILYREMTRVILLIGGTMPTMSNDDQRVLDVTSKS